MIGLRLKQLREANDLTQRQLADRAQVAPSVVTKIEYGLTLDPRWSSVVKLARALGVSLQRLIDDETPL